MNPNYQPLAEVRQKLRVEWYRCPIDSTKLRELMKRNDLQGWFQAVWAFNLACLYWFPKLLFMVSTDVVWVCHCVFRSWDSR